MFSAAAGKGWGTGVFTSAPIRLVRPHGLFPPSKERYVMRVKDTISIVALWLILTVVFGGIGVIILQWRTYRSLAEVGIATTGRVLAKEPANHRSVRF